MIRIRATYKSERSAAFAAKQLASKSYVTGVQRSFETITVTVKSGFRTEARVQCSQCPGFRKIS